MPVRSSVAAAPINRTFWSTGAGVGFMEAPVITYVGEISEPSLRGMLTSYSGLFVMLGLIVELLLGTLYGWNTAAFVSSFVPIITMVAISQVRRRASTHKAPFPRTRPTQMLLAPTPSSSTDSQLPLTRVLTAVPFDS